MPGVSLDVTRAERVGVGRVEVAQGIHDGTVDVGRNAHARVDDDCQPEASPPWETDRGDADQGASVGVLDGLEGCALTTVFVELW